MPIHVALHHRTAYLYDRLVTMSPQVVRLRPAPHCRTPVLSYSLQIQPGKHFLNWQQDPYGNYLARLVFPDKTKEFVVDVDLVAEMTIINPFDFFLEPEADTYPFSYPPALRDQLSPYLAKIAPTVRFESFLGDFPKRENIRTVDFLVELNRYVHHHVKYLIRLEPGVQTCDETIKRACGSCRDSAWLLAQMLRHLGLASRFVSGYLIQLKADIESLDGPSGATSDFTDLHAWTEVYLPGAGWVGLDPTSGLLAGEGHLPLAATPDPESAAPITGAVDECKTTFEFDMGVKRVREDPRVTKPYTEPQWSAICQLGEVVDQALADGPQTLTMGGEPTFVAIDDRDHPEWNTEALGKRKRLLAGDLFRRLAKDFATGPLLHFGQGKWYPGESLPRWSLSCYWRKDHKPIWRRGDLIAEDQANLGHTEHDASEFLQSLAKRLRVDAEHIQSAYEDVWYYMWKERKLPINVDPLKSRLTDPEERERLARIFEQGLDKVVGYALPLQPAYDPYGPRWESGPWFFRQERMYLIPGDSPMGYRLPLDSIPWSLDRDKPDYHGVDPLAEQPPLPEYDLPGRNGHPDGGGWSQGNGRPDRYVHRSVRGYVGPRWVTQLVGAGASVASADTDPFGAEQPALAVSELAPQPWSVVAGKASTIVRTAICAEARDGVLHVFLPPIAYLEHFLELITAIEATAAELFLPVRIEGYQPPQDYRLEVFRVTPDPGVIEVNMPPARCWNDLRQYTEKLYEHARLARLCTEKFMLDGRHTGTGGGNHIVLGGPKPAESPFLRRPDLLRSLVAYWNNRPSLSYLFSSLFIGPTSQAPRVDEARHESIHELETAFEQLPKDGHVRPWMVDRVLRHLLVDVTGNTHRAEFCIDKLYSPDTSSGRLGLVELRAFEMPPNDRMSLAQQLLVRALVAWFWKKPYEESLVRWRTTLHDRFMLPHFVAQDFCEVLDDLRGAGFAFDNDWFAPHIEFRFPIIGQVALRGITLELRQAIEPWHVLGEETGGGGTVRYVDSSVERVQVKVRGLTEPRFVIACNGRRVPLRETGAQGEFVAGVRFRAWQPPSCLHPTIGVHAPLIFDLLDSWNERSLGGCTWHVAHPGGRHFEHFPVNAFEAESRRAARFLPIGHTPGPTSVPPVEKNLDYPLTLDLRRPSEAAMAGA